MTDYVESSGRWYDLKDLQNIRARSVTSARSSLELTGNYTGHPSCVNSHVAMMSESKLTNDEETFHTFQVEVKFALFIPNWKYRRLPGFG